MKHEAQKSKRRIKGLALAQALILGVGTMTACSLHPSLSSEGPFTEGDSIPPGLHYYLARNVVEVTATETATTVRRPNAKLDGVESKTDREYQVEANLLTLPDLSNHYVIDLEPGRWTDSELSVKTTDDGRLVSINSAATGQVGNAVTSFFKLAATLAGSYGGVADAALAEDWPSGKPCRPSADLPDDVKEIIFTEEQYGSLTVWEPRLEQLPSSAIGKVAVLRDHQGCALWQKLEAVAHAIEQNRQSQAQVATLMRSADADAIKELIKRLDGLERGASTLKTNREEYLAAFKARTDVIVSTFNLGEKTTATVKRHWLATEDLPPNELVELHSDPQILKAALEKDYPNAAHFLEDTKFVLTQELLGGTGLAMNQQCGDKPKDGGDNENNESNENDTVRLFYRQALPWGITTYGPDDKGNLVKKDYDRFEIVDRQSLRCFEVSESGFAVRKLKIEFGPLGQPTLLERSGTSEGNTLAGAVATAATTARDTYADSLAKAVSIQESQRKLSLSDLETTLAEFKKRKELLDAEVALQGATSARESELERQQLAAELALLEARLKLEKAELGFDRQLALANIESDLLLLKEQLKLLTTQMAIKAAKEGEN